MAVTRVWRGRRDGRRLHGYNDAQICLQGHVINMFAETDSGRNEEHCSRCGFSTILACPHCKELIRGYFHDAYSGVTEPVPTVPRSFCHKCGKPYPWMEDRLQTAKELLYHDDKLSLEEREKLWGLLQYVMSDPKSDLAPAKAKLIDITLENAAAVTKDFVQGLLAKTFAEMLKP
jgi:hypothetical protein